MFAFKKAAEESRAFLRTASPQCSTCGWGNTRVEEACEMYTRAANMFKIAKNWSAAGNAFCQAAKLHMQLQSKHDSATSFVDAGNAYKKADPQEAINCLNAAIDIYTDMGRFTIAAKHHITIAEIYEAELVDIEKAIAHYEQAADYYKGEESNSSANKCLLKVAAYAAQLEQYQKAIEIYEQVGTNTMDNPLLKYSAKEYFFKAALCHFIVDELNAKLALEKYEEMFPAFTDSRECKLLKKLLEAHEEQNCEAYTEAVSSHEFAKVCLWMVDCSFYFFFFSPSMCALKCWVTCCPSSATQSSGAEHQAHHCLNSLPQNNLQERWTLAELLPASALARPKLNTLKLLVYG
ncbi:beta-soluble NSF attachment protein isoform 5-T5 [Morphnus guianensis]